MNSALDYVRKHLTESRDALAAADTSEFSATLIKIADALTAALRAGGKVMLCGNGGSAADAQHIATELMGRYEIEREPVAALALTTDTSALTAISNDYGFEHVFARQVRGLGRKGDVLIGLSTSGKSPNVLAALDAAREMGIVAIGFTGKKGGDLSSCCDIVLNAPSDRTPVIQQIHMTAAHIVCGLVERAVGAKR
jgi:D-sedoheptulose 7-phosphate isomerase